VFTGGGGDGANQHGGAGDRCRDKEQAGLGGLQREGSTGREAPELADVRTRFVKEWFQNTVPSFLSGNPISGPALVHFDADSYSSTLFLLTTLWHHVPEYHFSFDEFQPDEIVSMYDFTCAYLVDFEFIACTQDEYERPQQVFGRLRNIPFSLG
jgi:hypothetical protein